MPVMKQNAYYILLSLTRGPRHGLAITRDVIEFSGGETRLWPAALYGTLQDLADRGWIEEIHPSDEKRRPDASERKRYYGLTKAGRAAAEAETQRLAGLVRLARSAARRGQA
jgi:DNA-binding PadR family transcriptional regulator